MQEQSMVNTIPNLPEVFIQNISSSDQGTIGLLSTEGFSCKTLQLPWRNNTRQISRIPDGEYICKIALSPKFGAVYKVFNVPGRSEILLHAGNYAGTKPKFKSHVEGCILLGMKLGTLEGQLAVLQSRIAVTAFMAHMLQKPFKLIIKSKEGV
jgi:hypothetical protein